MIQIIIRAFKRFAVLLPGLALTYLAVFEIYPDINKRTPAALAMILTYVLTAYVLIPAALRLIRIIFKPNHIPLYCVTPDGFASDPVNIGIVGTRAEVINAMSKAGWFLADERTPNTLLRMGLSLLLKQSYPNAPFSNLYLFGRRQDFGFELPAADNPSHRHHVRFWAADYSQDKTYHHHVRFWHKLHPDRNLNDDIMLWVGAASQDTGLAFIRHNAQVTHMIHPNTDAERDLIVNHLKHAGLVKKIKSITAGNPYSLKNRVWRGYLSADGKLKVIELKHSL